jgi:hypothetical protein
MLWISCHLWLACDSEVALIPLMLTAASSIEALVFRLMLGFPICCFSLLLLKKAGA